MDKIILYKTDFFQHAILVKKLKQKGIPFTVDRNVVKTSTLNFLKTKPLSVNGKKMSFETAKKWIDEQEAVQNENN